MQPALSGRVHSSPELGGLVLCLSLILVDVYRRLRLRTLLLSIVSKNTLYSKVYNIVATTTIQVHTLIWRKMVPSHRMLSSHVAQFFLIDREHGLGQRSQ